MTGLVVALDLAKINALAAKMGPKKNYPVVVIGAGLGGLCCGAYLAKQGVPVTVVEQLHEKGGKFIKLLFPVQYRKMWNIRNKTLADFLNDHVKNPEVQSVLSSLWGYYGLPPSKLSAFYYANATGGYLRHGSFYIRERSQNLSFMEMDA